MPDEMPLPPTYMKVLTPEEKLKLAREGLVFPDPLTIAARQKAMYTGQYKPGLYPPYTTEETRTMLQTYARLKAELKTLHTMTDGESACKAAGIRLRLRNLKTELNKSEVYKDMMAAQSYRTTTWDTLALLGATLGSTMIILYLTKRDQKGVNTYLKIIRDPDVEENDVLLDLDFDKAKAGEYLYYPNTAEVYRSPAYGWLGSPCMTLAFAPIKQLDSAYIVCNFYFPAPQRQFLGVSFQIDPIYGTRFLYADFSCRHPTPTGGAVHGFTFDEEAQPKPFLLHGPPPRLDLFRSPYNAAISTAFFITTWSVDLVSGYYTDLMIGGENYPPPRPQFHKFPVRPPDPPRLQLYFLVHKPFNTTVNLDNIIIYNWGPYLEWPLDQPTCQKPP